MYFEELGEVYKTFCCVKPYGPHYYSEQSVLKCLKISLGGHNLKCNKRYVTEGLNKENIL